jgi:hypothetical protein
MVTTYLIVAAPPSDVSRRRHGLTASNLGTGATGNIRRNLRTPGERFRGFIKKNQQKKEEAQKYFNFHLHVILMHKIVESHIPYNIRLEDTFEQAV